MTTSKAISRHGKDASGCHIDIRIESQGDVNIYNCTAPAPHDQPCPSSPPTDCATEPIAPGQCIPLTLGAKPKQSQRTKLNTLLNNTRVPSALAASFFHEARRFLAGHAPANQFEESAFGVLRALPPDLKSILSCALTSFDALGPGERDRLFDPTLPTDPSVPLDATILATAFAREITQRVGVQVFGDPNGVEQERPGQNRFFKPEGEFFDVQLRVCSVNDLRTNEFAPPLAPADYKPEELQQHCEPILVNGTPQLSCEVQTSNCPGNFLSDGTNVTCLRVPEVKTGDAVVLQGVNFISVDATVRLTAQPPGTVTREVDAHVVGDIETPRTEVVNGVSQLIRDCRVHDRLSFRVPDDLPPGIYAVQIVLPNVSGIPELGDPIVSNQQFVRVVPPDTARFQITSETLTARKETSPAFFGSDEVRVRVRAYPITASLTDLILGDEQAFDSPEFGDMDSGDVRDMTAVLFGHQQPIDAMVMSIMGFEIDSEKAYREQINSFTDAFLHYLKIALAAIGAGVGGAALAIGLKDLLALGLAHPIVLVIAAAVVAAVVLFLAAWAPADPIIADQIGLTSVELAALTSAEFPMPAPSEYPTESGIKVKVTPLEKTPTQYRERREYISDEEDSRYEIVLRYNRVA
jgi:hypothetical protein